MSDYEKKKKKKTERGKDTRVAVSRMRTTQAWQANFHVHAFLIKSNKYIYIYIYILSLHTTYLFFHAKHGNIGTISSIGKTWGIVVKGKFFIILKWVIHFEQSWLQYKAISIPFH